ncbi:MAG: hypothetical protein IJH84_08815, partial [Saccharopolyspora sp.]|nr:hypothetical protein [Saccharopolyspora sp.]
MDAGEAVEPAALVLGGRGGCRDAGRVRQRSAARHREMTAARHERLGHQVAVQQRRRAQPAGERQLRQRPGERELRGQAERAQRDGDFDTASKLLYGEIPTLERDLEAASEAEEEVGPDDIADVVGSWTGIPAGRLLEGETQKLLRMEAELGRRL